MTYINKNDASWGGNFKKESKRKARNKNHVENSEDFEVLIGKLGFLKTTPQLEYITMDASKIELWRRRKGLNQNKPDNTLLAYKQSDMLFSSKTHRQANYEKEKKKR